MLLKVSQWLFLTLVFSLPFVRPFNFFAFGLRVAYTDLIFVAAAGSALIVLALGKLRLRYDQIFLFISLYAAALTISSVLPEASFVKLLSEYYLFGLCFLAFLHCSDRTFLKRVILTWVAAAGITGLLSVIGVAMFYAGLTSETNNYFLSHLGSLPPGNYPRVQSLFANPNMLCNFLNISIPLIWLGRRSGWIAGWLANTLIGLTLVAALFSLSSGLGGIALSMGLIGYLVLRENPAQRRLALAAGILVALVILAATLVSPDTPNTQQRVPFSNAALEPSVRVLVWENVIERVSRSPILGRGVGSHPAEKEYIPLTGERQFLTDAHNMYLNVLGQSGVLGLACFILLLLHLLRRVKWRPENSDDLLLPVLICSFVGTVLYQGLTGSFEDARHVWVLIAMLAAASSTRTARSGTSPASTELSHRLSI